MSTLCAIFGLDDKPGGERGHASAYLISDSYVTDTAGRVLRTDAQKIFASVTTTAILGYVGDEQIEGLLARTVAELDRPDGLFRGSYGSTARADALIRLFAAAMPANYGLNYGSTIIYIGRTYGGRTDDSRFHIWQFERPKQGDWIPTELQVPPLSGPPMINGKPVEFWGTGGGLLEVFDEHRLGRLKNYKEFTWAYFRAVIEALQRGHDERSGGSVQVGFLPRGGNGRYVGVIRGGKKFVCGKPLSATSPAVERWIDKDFDECDPVTLAKRLDRKRSPIV